MAPRTEKSRTAHAALAAFAALLACLALPARAPALTPLPTFKGAPLAHILHLRDQCRRYGRIAGGPQKRLRPLAHIRTIVIDPGHGGENRGALGVAGVDEKYLTMELAWVVRERLQERFPHARVVMTRYWDQSRSFAERVHLANVLGADLFISLHYNAASHDRAVGVETYFLPPEAVTPGQAQPQSEPVAAAAPLAAPLQALPEAGALHGLHQEALAAIRQDMARALAHQQSARLAEAIQKPLAHQLAAPDRGVKQGNFAVLRGALMPAVIVEAGFLTHPLEGLRLTRDEHRQKAAKAIVEAIEAYDRELGLGAPR